LHAANTITKQTLSKTSKLKMKKLIVAGVMALCFSGAGAQNKIGYVNTEDVIAAMPETDKANKELQELQESLAKQYEDLQKEANEKSEKFVKDSSTYSASMKEIKRDEIIKLIQRVNNFQQEAQDKTKEAAQLKFAPIQQKALDAIKAVAKKSGYAYILDLNSVIVGPDGDNVLALVKKELGIKDTPAAPAKEQAAPASKPAGKQ
jgi:outer membrane protein